MAMLNVIIAAILVVTSEAAVKNRRITDSDGNNYEITQISNAEEDIALIKKDGNIVEQQIVHQQKGYIVYKQNETCSVEFHEEMDQVDENQCYRGTIPNEDEITSEIKQECGDLEIVYVRLADCPDLHKVHTDHADGGIMKRCPCKKVFYLKFVCGWLGCILKVGFYWRC